MSIGSLFTNGNISKVLTSISAIMNIVTVVAVVLLWSVGNIYPGQKDALILNERVAALREGIARLDTAYSQILLELKEINNRLQQFDIRLTRKEVERDKE
ncbi:MAG: hypothetical protein KatS3mg087_1314 [Patescibacteria group bacterium]|nr:MAG: hypothetical protein KatS3mg087_1314 [Patescibacteria group bacterium]